MTRSPLRTSRRAPRSAPSSSCRRPIADRQRQARRRCANGASELKETSAMRPRPRSSAVSDCSTSLSCAVLKSMTLTGCRGLVRRARSSRRRSCRARLAAPAASQRRPAGRACLRRRALGPDDLQHGDGAGADEDRSTHRTPPDGETPGARFGLICQLEKEQTGYRGGAQIPTRTGPPRSGWPVAAIDFKFRSLNSEFEWPGSCIWMSGGLMKLIGIV